MSELTGLDKFIGWISPRWGAKRAEYRMELRSYDAARRDQQGGNWYPLSNASPETTDAPHRTIVRARMRDLERNGDVTEGVIDAILRNVVGGGFVLEAQVTNSRGRPLDVINDKIEELWNEWCKAENCDVTGDSSFSELLEIIVRRWEVDGEVFIVKVVDPNGFLPLRLQIIEPDLLAEDLFQYEGRYVFGGIEVDRYMKAVAYHFRPDPLPYFKDQTIVRFPRSEVIHLRSKKRPQQLRSMPDMTVCSERVRNIQEYLTNELEAARTASSITAFVIKDKGAGAPGIGNPMGGVKTKDSRIEEIRRNQLNYMGKEEDVRFPTPGRPNMNASGFVAFLLRMIGMSRGLSYETVSRDLSQVNYSSHRGGQLEDRKTYTKKQNKLKSVFCDPVYEWFVEAAVLSGKLNIPNYFSDDSAAKRYTAHRWSLPGWEWIDPQKEAAAIEKQLTLGITTLADVCGKQGKDWYEILKQRKEEVDAACELGINLPWFTGEVTTSPQEYEELMKDKDEPPSKKEGENDAEE